MISLLVLPFLALLGADHGPKTGVDLPVPLTQPDHCDDAFAPGFLQERHGRVVWFEGTYDEARTKARAEDRVILLNFYTDNSRCRKLDREAYCDDKVVAALVPVVCLSVDSESEIGKALITKYPTENYFPALIFLDADGALRDRLIGYADSRQMLGEIERILRDEGTLGDLRRKSEAKPDDVLALWDYARKLEELDDLSNFQLAVERLRALDPEGKSLPLRTLLMREAAKACSRDNNYAPLREFLETETFGELLFDGWMRISQFEQMQAKAASMGNDASAALAHRLAAHRARFEAWPHCPKPFAPFYGNNIAWDIYLEWPTIPDDLRREAIQVARQAVASRPEEAELLDTLACLLFNDGQVDEAVRLMRKCLQLEPDRDLWVERLEMFEKEEA